MIFKEGGGEEQCWLQKVGIPPVSAAELLQPAASFEHLEEEGRGVL